jgi:plastocyanin
MNKLLFTLALSTLAIAASAGSLSVSVVDKDGKPVPNAVVVVLPSNKSAQPKVPLPMQAAINQEKMQFIPVVTLVPVGAKVRFVNSDPWDHHIRSSPAGMGQFNSTVAGFEMRLEGKQEGKPEKMNDVIMDQPGEVGPTLLGCFIHSSMRGYLYVSSSPWAVKTGADGLATFDDLPDGAAQVKLWQSDQLLDLPMQSTTIGATAAKSTFQLTVVQRRVHATSTAPQKNYF